MKKLLDSDWLRAVQFKCKSAKLTNLMWFSVVCTLVHNGMHNHSGQNVVESQGAASTNQVHALDDAIFP